MAVLLTPPKLQFFDNSGAPLAFGRVYTYTSTGGTFTTLKDTYTTQAGNVANTNPIILDSAGRANIWISGSYDFKVCDSDDVQLYTQLAVTAFTALPAESDSYFESFSGTGLQTAFTTSQDLGTDESAIQVFVDNSDREYVTNGSFVTNTGWTKGSGWTIGSGVATASGAISTAIEQTAASTISQYNVYTITYTITRSAGGLIPSIGGTSGTERTASGTYTETIIAGSTQTIAFTGNGFTGTLDDVSIKVANPEGFQILAPTMYTINGTSLTVTTAPASGTNNIYVFAPSLQVGAASSAAADAAASAAAALASENQAGAYAGQLTIVSTTSTAIGTGSKSFTVGSGLSLNAGQFILIASDAAPTTNYMWGTITSYSSTTLQVSVAATSGSGTYADWTMYLTGERGEAGATGSVSATTAVTASSNAGFVLESVNGNDCLEIGVGGGAVMTAKTDLAMGTNSITGLADPTNAQDAATKNYVDTLSRFIQRSTTQTGAVATGTTVIPYDDTIPQITEGTEFMTASITPTSSSNLLRIDVVANGNHSAAGRNIFALFQDATANALAVQDGASISGSGSTGPVMFTYWMTAGTTSSTTFRVRGGSQTAGTFTFNGSGGSRLFGGVYSSSITITEYQA